MRLIAAAALIALALPAPVSAQASMKDMGSFCLLIEQVDQPWVRVGHALPIGECMGVLKALHFAYQNQTFCAPDAIKFAQMGAVVGKYVEQHPERWHENFIAVAKDALAQAWPCRRP